MGEVFGNTKIILLCLCTLRIDIIVKGNEDPGTVCGGIAKCRCRKTVNHYEMDCSNRSLNDVPTNIPWNVTKIDLSTNKLTYIHWDAFITSTKLQEIDLSYNGLKYLPEDLLSSCSDLRALHLGNNQLSTIPTGFFRATPKIVYLTMSKNRFQILNKAHFHGLKSIHYLTLSGNRITSLPADIFSELQLNCYLDLSQNLLSEIPDGLWKTNINYHKLQYLLLQRNNLTFLSNTSFFGLPNLTEIDLSYNGLKYLPEDLLSNCSDLTALHLGNNQLSTIPTGFFRATPKIVYLTMSKNRFQILNKAHFHGLKSIHYLTLSGNRITSLPADIFSELQLNCYLDLSQNLLSEIPDGLWKTNINYHKLQYLLLQRNNLTFLSNTSFFGLPNLTEIFLNGNSIKYIGENTFNCSSIEDVYLFENAITELTNNSFGRGVSYVHLYKNNISNISDSALDGMGNARIFLNCENLHQLPWSKNKFFGYCVHNTFVPEVIFKASKEVLKTFFQNQGFMCQKFGSKEKCRPCAPGLFANGYGMCRECPRGGFFQDEIGSKKCKKCSNGNFVKEGSGLSALDCTTCPDGTDHSIHAGFRACFCKRNYTRIDRFGLCTLCLPEGLNCNNDFKSLSRGYYWNWSFPGMNVSLYSSFVTNLLTLNDSYDPSTTRYNLKIPRVFKCPRPENCPNSDSHTPTGINGNCQAGYRGWLCSKCQNTFYSVLNYCAPCQQKWWIISEIIITFSAGLLIVILVIWKNTKALKKDERLFVNKLSSRMKIFLGFYQVVGDLYESVNVVSWIGPLRYVGKLISLVSLKLLKIIIRPQCLNSDLLLDPIIRFNIVVIFPIGIIFVMALIYFICKVYLQYCEKTINAENMVKLDKIKSKLLTYVVLILFITYQPTCDAIFEIYPGACDTFQVDREGNITISLLRADYDINCKSIAHYQTEAYIATVLYVIAYPLILLILLRKYCRKLPEEKVIKEINNDDCCINSLSANEMTPLLSGHQATCRTIPTCLKFLTENYKEQFWFWEILELGRKVGQTMLITLLGWEDALTKLFTIGTSVLFLSLHVKFSPMKSPFEQHLQLFSLIAIFLNILVAAVPVAVQYQATLSTLLILLDVGIVLAVAGEVLLVFIRFVRRKVTKDD
ncbi:uncharacterized protein [Apostichopus japonicus]|uniref:uncharacterized protein isoform X4 n=1 Tax=Stichopus japonicus TaxID=307972 RepID=UPI003AB29DBB